ncbi:unnamed protein product, partial [Scytosiphon promiscuus]
MQATSSGTVSRNSKRSTTFFAPTPKSIAEQARAKQSETGRASPGKIGPLTLTNAKKGSAAAAQGRPKASAIIPGASIKATANARKGQSAIAKARAAQEAKKQQAKNQGADGGVRWGNEASSQGRSQAPGAMSSPRSSTNHAPHTKYGSANRGGEGGSHGHNSGTYGVGSWSISSLASPSRPAEASPVRRKKQQHQQQQRGAEERQGHRPSTPRAKRPPKTQPELVTIDDSTDEEEEEEDVLEMSADSILPAG